MVIVTPSVDEKLENFNRMILRDAAASRDNVLENLQRDTDAKLAASKAAIEREITEIYHREITKSVQQKESLVSKATVNARKSIISVRNEILDSVMADLTKRFLEFTKSPDYEAWLTNNIEDAMAYVLPGNAQLHLTSDDLDRYQEKIAARFPGVTFFTAESGIIGGCCAAAPDKNLYVDNSLENKINCGREELFANSGLKLSDS